MKKIKSRTVESLAVKNKKTSKTAFQYFFFACLLIVSIFGAYAKPLHYGFYAIDDRSSLLLNEHIRHGLGIEGFYWAFTTYWASTWAPTYWLSHLFIVEFFGNSAYAHHTLNLTLHLFNSLLVFFLLPRLVPNTIFPKPFVFFCFTLLWALHPVHIEPIVWITSRDTLLAGFFCLLSFHAWLSRRQSRFFLLSSFLFYALALASKPSVLMFPYALILHAVFYQTDKRMIGKDTLVLLYFIAASNTLLIALTNLQPDLDHAPFLERLYNSLIAYGESIATFFKPENLAFCYPFPSLDLAHLAGALSLLLAGSLLSIFTYRKTVGIAYGWTWFLVMLFPFSGISSSRAYFFADRYLYLPSIGLVVLFVSLLGFLYKGVGRKQLLAYFLILLLVYCSVNSVPLFRVSQASWSNPAIQYLQFSVAAGKAPAKDFFELGVHFGQMAHRHQGEVKSRLFRRALEYTHMALEKDPYHLDAAMNRFLFSGQLGMNRQQVIAAERVVQISMVKQDFDQFRRLKEVGRIFLFYANHLEDSQQVNNILPEQIELYRTVGKKLIEKTAKN